MAEPSTPATPPARDGGGASGAADESPRHGHGHGAEPVPRSRHIWVNVLIWATTVLAIVGIFAIWANRQMFNAHNWANTSSKLLQNEQIRDATSAYLVDQLYANVNVEQEIKQRLPKQIQPLAGPLSGGLRSLANEAAKRAFANPRVQEAWKNANHAADQTL